MDAKFVVVIYSTGITVTGGMFDNAKFARNFAKDCVKRCASDDQITVYHCDTGNRVYHVESGEVIVDRTEDYLVEDTYSWDRFDKLHGLTK